MLQDPTNLAPSASCLEDTFDRIWKYPEHLGQGYWRSIQLRPGLLLEIGDYQLHKPLIVESPERAHPLGCSFWTLKNKHGHTGSVHEEFFLSGTGNACEDWCEYLPGQHNFEVTVHVEPDVFCASVSDRCFKVAQHPKAWN